MSKTKPGFLILIPGNNAIHVPSPHYFPNLKICIKQPMKQNKSLLGSTSNGTQKFEN